MPTTWLELSIAVPHEYVEPVSYLFSRYGRALTVESDRESEFCSAATASPSPESGGEADGAARVILRTYLPAGSRERFARIEVGIKLVSLLEPLGDLIVNEVKEEDWQNSWKSHFHLLKIGSRLVIKPSWIEYQEQAGDVVIEIDPGMAFGTGYHPTTYTCLQALEEWVRPGASVLDVGVGSGILSIAALRLGAGSVTGLDIDSQAVRAARQNFRRVGVTRQVTLAQGSVPHAAAKAGQFDLAAANISARAVCERAQFICPTLRPEGALIASGMVRGQEGQVVETLEGLGWSAVQEWAREDWVTLAFQADSR